MDLKSLLKKISPPGAQWVGIRTMESRERDMSAVDEVAQPLSLSVDRGAMVEVMVDGVLGYGATQQLSEEGLKKAAEMAMRHARASGARPVQRFEHQQIRPAVQGEYHTPVEKSPWNLSHKDAFDILVPLSKRLRISESIVNTYASLSHREEITRMVSTSGTDISQTYCFLNLGLQAVGQKGSIIQKRNLHSHYATQQGLEAKEFRRLEESARRIAEQTLELLDAEECPNITTDLVLAPDQMMLQIHESIGHPLELDRILGDERNYAGSSFVKLADFGTLQYGSSLLNVTFDPTRSSEFASYGFDDAGHRATKEYLIKNGLLMRGLGGLESQVRSGVPGVANFRASSWNRPAVDRMANINLEPGDSSFDDIIGSIERGIYMDTNSSWSIDDYRNKFQFGCQYARLIENGKLTRVVRNPNYRGITNSFWNNLFLVGNSSTLEIHGTPYCGKAEPNQVIRVGHASPVCAFRNIEVFGGG